MHDVSFLEILSVHLILPHPFLFHSLKHREGPKNVLSVNVHSKEAPLNHCMDYKEWHTLAKYYPSEKL